MRPTKRVHPHARERLVGHGGGALRRSLPENALRVYTIAHRVDKETHRRGELCSSPLILVPAHALYPTRGIIEYIRVGDDVLLDTLQHLWGQISVSRRTGVVRNVYLRWTENHPVQVVV